jgi:hypothetical protein
LASARVDVTSAAGDGRAKADGPTTLNLTGSGFQSIQGGFGGIYVLFGTVNGNWRPSQGGLGGRDFLYVPDSQTKDNAGREKFVAFPGSETAGSANGGQIDSQGNWSTQLEVPGPTFTVEDASGKAVEVDCRVLQCGVITIGAHGVVNANNETFTPVSFSSTSTALSGQQSAEPSASAPPTTQKGTQVASLGVDPTTAVAGHALAFTGRGFEAGEQVTAVLDDGAVSVGPLTAGKFGEVAGVLPLATDLQVGSHTLTLTGAASGTSAETLITVRRDPSLVEQAEAMERGQAELGEETELTPWQIAIVVAALVLLVVLAGSLTAAAATRKARRKAALKRAATGAGPDSRPDGAVEPEALTAPTATDPPIVGEL